MVSINTDESGSAAPYQEPQPLPEVPWSPYNPPEMPVAPQPQPATPPRTGGHEVIDTDLDAPVQFWENNGWGQRLEMERENWNKLDTETQSDILKYGYKVGITGAENRYKKAAEAVEKENAKAKAEYEAATKSQQEALDKLKPYRVASSGTHAGTLRYSYDIQSYLRESENPAEALKTLKQAGYSDEVIQKATKANLVEGQKAAEAVRQQYSNANLAKKTGSMVADLVVPGYYTAGNWTNMGNAERALSVTLDVLTILPFAKAAGTGAREVATAGRIDRLAGAAKGIGKEAIAQTVAPVTMIAHPVATVKGTAGAVKDLAENLLHPSKLPEAVLTTTNETVKLKITEATTPEKAMEIRDALVKAAAKGDTPILEVDGVKYELSRSPLTKEAGGGLVHATPDIEVLEGTKVTAKPGMPEKEQGWFLATEPATDFTKSSAFGKDAIPVPVQASGTVTDIGNYRPKELVNLDKPAIRTLDFKDTKNIPNDIADPLLDYARKQDAVVYGSVNEWVKVKGAAQPNDVDLVFKNPEKAIRDIQEIAEKAGYKTRRVPHGVEILNDGEWVKLGDIVSEDQHQKMLPLPMVTNRVNGVRVETLGKQYIGQSYGAVDKSDKAATRAKKLEKAAADVKQMIKESGITKKKPGIFIISPESAKKAVSSEKLYHSAAEMEAKLPVGAKIPEPKQKLFSRIGPERTRIEVWLEKPLTKAQIVKLKSLGVIEDLKAPFKPAITISGDAATMDAKGAKKLASFLDDTGNTRTARTLRRARSEIGRAAGTGRVATRLARDTRGRASESRTSRASARVSEGTRASNRIEVSRTSRAIREQGRTTRATTRDGRADSTRITEERFRPSGTEPERTNAPRPPEGRTRIPPPPERYVRPPDERETPPPRIPPPRISPPRIPTPRPPHKEGGKGRKVSSEAETKAKEKPPVLLPGSLVWEQGRLEVDKSRPGPEEVFYYAEPDSYQTKVSVGVPPKGYRNTGDTPKATIQTIGGPTKRVVDVNLGITTAHALPDNKKITFTRNTPRITPRFRRLK